MKILAIGDPHGDLKKIKKIPMNDIDLILITGDLGSVSLARKLYFDNIKRKQRGLNEINRTAKIDKKIRMEVYDSTVSVLKYLSKYAPVYTIEGNVSISTPSEVKKIKKESGISIPSLKLKINKMKNVSLVNNKVRSICGLRIGFLDYFTDVCWFYEFKPDDYKRSLKEAKKETLKIKKILNKFKKVDILVCHQPPYGILDKVSSKYNPPKDWIGKHAGSKTILNYIKKYNPSYVFCGHIHEGEGVKYIGRTKVYNLGVVGYKIIDTH